MTEPRIRPEERLGYTILWQVAGANGKTDKVVPAAENTAEQSEKSP